MTMTDKTSTAPVMSLQKVRDALHKAHNSPGFEAVLDSCVAAIDAHLNAPTPDVVGGGVVAWQCRCRLGGEWSEWQECEKDDFDKRTPLSGWDDGYLETEYRQLCVYAAPRVQGDADAVQLEAAARAMQTVCDGGDRWNRLSNEVRARWIESARPVVATLAAQPKGDVSRPAEQTRGEPVAYRYALESGKWTVFISKARAKFLADHGATVEPLYTAQPKPGQTRGDGVEVWMIRRNDGEVHWDETGCVFHDEASASQEARLMTDSDPDGYSFGAFALRSSAPRQAVPDGLDLLRLIRDARHRICNGAAGKANGQAPKDHPVYGPLLRRLDEADAMLAAAPSAGRMGVE